MQSPYKIHTTVLPGGRIEVHTPDLPVGQAVEVAIRIADEHTARRSATDILAEAPGHRLFKTADDVDAYIRAERDAWDR